MFNFLCDGEGTASTAATPGINIGVYIVLLVALVALIVFPMFTQRKRNREYEAMIGALKVGDLVKTAGGIIGRIKSISDKGEIKTVILETGSKTEKSYMEFDISMVACVLKSTKTQTEAVNENDIEDETEDEDDTEIVDDVQVEENSGNNTGVIEEPKVEEVLETSKTESEISETTEEPTTEEKKPIKKTTSKKSSVKKNKK